MSKYMVVMRCSTPVMNADGSVKYQPGDQIPEDHPDVEEHKHSFAPFLINTVQAPEGVDEPAIQDTNDPHPESSVRTADEPVAEAVDF